MVPLRLDVCDIRPRAFEAPARPALVLKDLTAERAPHRAAEHGPLRRIENVLLIASLVATLLFFLVSFALSAFHTVQQAYFPSATPPVMMITKTVTPGMTLTSLAKQYGDPNVYILDRVEQLVRANHLSGTAPLVPGQHLLIPVTNRTLIAQILQNYHHTVVAAR